MPIYVELANDIGKQIEEGVLRAGEQLPSVRSLCSTRRVSQGTVMQAYYLLEDRGVVSSRARSGFYVNATTKKPLPKPETLKAPVEAVTVEITHVLFTVLDSIKHRENVPFGSALLSPTLFPLQKLGQQLGITARRLDPWRIVDDLPPGNPELRRYIARRYLEMGCSVGKDEIVITHGASEALQLCIYATTKPGDIVAIESPSHYLALHAIETTGRRAAFIPTSAQHGIDLVALERAIAEQPIRAVWAMPTFQNPTGALMSPAKKRALVELLTRHDIPLIENDVYGEMHFDESRPPPAKSWDRTGTVLHCSSFSKVLSPGYRIGWVAPGRYFERVRQHKFLLSVASNIAAQEAIATFVKHGGYELHLRRLRASLLRQRDALLRAITRHFPKGTRVSRPRGGYFLWLQLPPGSLSSSELMKLALAEGISLAPGLLFSIDDRFRCHLRLNYGHPWTAEMEHAIQRLAEMLNDSLTQMPISSSQAGSTEEVDELSLP